MASNPRRGAQTVRDPGTGKPKNFLGRTKLVHEVLKELSTPGHGIVLVGAGGIGKTSLANRAIGNLTA